MSLAEDEVKSICADLLNAEVDKIEFPGGSSREGTDKLIIDLRQFRA